ncbi:FtsB family cell division protein [Paenibacillus rigui]|uniref:Cell division protein n=1 Tax=Paenibacillus rigui TaxID=554312 RepID=A0A229UGS1_9BACL|nr:septum formation initiator family protein [Paenibacillus rigui]OXM82593.1 cell division protein [Paenibacillus rigui]
MRAVPTTSVIKDAKSHNKGSFRRRRLVMIVLACFMSWAGVTLWNQVGKLNARSEKAALLEQKLKETQQAHEDAQREIARLNDPEYVEQKIRKELHYVKQGETLFYVAKEQKK